MNVFLILFLNLVGGGEFGITDSKVPHIDETLNVPSISSAINYSTVNVNNSNCWLGYCTEASLLHSSLGNLPWSQAKHTIDTDLNLTDKIPIRFGIGGLTGALGSDSKLYSDGTDTYLQIESPTGVFGSTNPILKFSYQAYNFAGLTWYYPRISTGTVWNGIFYIDHYLSILDRTGTYDGYIIISNKTNQFYYGYQFYNSSGDNYEIGTTSGNISLKLNPAGNTTITSNLIVDRNVTAILFKGNFNLTSIDAWNYFNGNALSFNGTQLNSSLSWLNNTANQFSVANVTLQNEAKSWSNNLSIGIIGNLNITGSLNMTGNMTLVANGTICYNPQCSAFTYWNGSLLITKVN